MVNGLVDVESAEGSQFTSFSVRGKRFGYYWPRTQTVGLKQTISEQQALVSERPDVFESSSPPAVSDGWSCTSTASRRRTGRAGLRAWRLSAPEELVAEVPDWRQTASPDAS